MEDPNKIRDELDAALNPQKNSLDVLSSQVLHEIPEPPSGIHDFAEIQIKNPMELDLSSVPEIPLVPINPDEKENNPEIKKPEIFDLPHRFLVLINNLELYKTEPDKRKIVNFELTHRSLDVVKRNLNKFHYSGYINEKEYVKALNMLDGFDVEKDALAEYVSEKDLGDFSSFAGNKNKEDPLAAFASEGDIKKADSVEPSAEATTLYSDIGSAPELNHIKELDEEFGRQAFDFLKNKDYKYARLNAQEIKNSDERESLLNLINEQERKENITKPSLASTPIYAPVPEEAIPQPIPEPVVVETEKTEDKEISVELAPAPTPELIPAKESVPEPASEPVAPVAVTEAVPESEVKIDTSEAMDQIDVELAEAREDYAKAQIEYRKKNSKFKKISELVRSLISNETSGTHPKEKTQTEIELEEAKVKMDEALVEYIKVKNTRKVDLWDSLVAEAEKNNNIEAGKFSEDINKEILVNYKMKLLEVAESEWNELQNETDKNSPKNETWEKTKDRMAKAHKIWSKVPMSVRLLAAPVLIGGAVALAPVFGVAGGLAAGATYAKIRTTRAVVGAGAARGVGSGLDKINSGVNEKAQKNYESAYTDENGTISSEEKEKQYMEAREKEMGRKKNQRVVKALAMVGAGAGVGILAGMAESSIEHALSSGPHTSADSLAIKSKPFDGIRPKASVIHETPTQAPAVDILGTKTALSTEGYLQDIHNLKANILRQYGLGHVPPEIQEHIINKSSVDIAKEYGLYRPGDIKGDSAMGLAGEKLSVDTNGHLVIEHVDGTKDFLSDAKTGGIKKFTEFEGNKMFTPEPPKVSMQPLETSPINESIVGGTTMSEIVPAEPALMSYPIDDSVLRGVSIQETIPSTGSAVPAETLSTHISFHDSFVDVVDKGGSKAVVFGGVEIAHEHAFGTGKILTLDDKFQDGPQYKDIRGAFAEAFNKTPADLLGKTPHMVDFEGGKVYVVQGVAGNENAVTVLQNGREIAKGLVTEKGANIKINSDLKGGLFGFLVQTPYERALNFKAVKDVIKALKVVN